MNRSPTSPATMGLARYVRAVVDRLGGRVFAFDCDVDEEIATAILVMKQPVPTFPELTLVLTWDEINGWALRIKTTDDGDTEALAFLGEQLLPEPEKVERFLTEATSGHHPGDIEAPRFRHPNDDDDLDVRLAQFV